MGTTTDLLYHMVKGIPTFAAIEKRAVAQATALFFVQDGPLWAAGMGLPAASPYGVGVRDSPRKILRTGLLEDPFL